MIQYNVYRLIPRLNSIFFYTNRNASSINLQTLEKESTESGIEVAVEENKAVEEIIEAKRNKSRLKVHDREFLFERNPYEQPTRWHQGTLKYMRRLYGRYGEASGVNPVICWPVSNELNTAQEYERIAFPYQIQEVVKERQSKKIERETRIQLRQVTITQKLQKLDQWKQELHQRISKKEGEALAAKQRKERLIEEVRMHFGYTVDSRDEKFKEMVEKKEKEQKKAMKEERRKVREENLLSKMLSKKNEKQKQATNEEK